MVLKESLIKNAFKVEFQRLQLNNVQSQWRDAWKLC